MRKFIDFTQKARLVTAGLAALSMLCAPDAFSQYKKYKSSGAAPAPSRETKKEEPAAPAEHPAQKADPAERERIALLTELYRARKGSAGELEVPFSGVRPDSKITIEADTIGGGKKAALAKGCNITDNGGAAELRAVRVKKDEYGSFQYLPESGAGAALRIEPLDGKLKFILPKSAAAKGLYIPSPGDLDAIVIDGSRRVSMEIDDSIAGNIERGKWTWDGKNFSYKQSPEEEAFNLSADPEKTRSFAEAADGWNRTVDLLRSSEREISAFEKNMDKMRADLDKAAEAARNERWQSIGTGSYSQKQDPFSDNARISRSGGSGYSGGAYPGSSRSSSRGISGGGGGGRSLGDIAGDSQPAQKAYQRKQESFDKAKADYDKRKNDLDETLKTLDSKRGAVTASSSVMTAEGQGKLKDCLHETRKIDMAECAAWLTAERKRVKAKQDK
jgi:hypothetical protein